MRLISTFALLIISLSITTHGQETEQELPLVADLGTRVVTLVKPKFPETATAVGLDGTSVSLNVFVDTNGIVTSARCFQACPAILKDAAELAASLSRFKPLIIDGKAVNYKGILTYGFVVERVSWARVGTYLESTRQFDNISFTGLSELLTNDFAKEKKHLLSLNGVDYEARQQGIREVEASIRGKLNGTDLWRFEMAMALRRVTFWTVAAERTDRPTLQEAIDALPKIIAKAPEGIPAKLVEDLKAISRYRVPADIGERELRQEIDKMARTIRLEM